MMNAILKFKNLSDLATYQKQMKFDAYVINTSALTLLRVYNELELAIAIEEYGAAILEKFEIPQ